MWRHKYADKTMHQGIYTYVLFIIFNILYSLSFDSCGGSDFFLCTDVYTIEGIREQFVHPEKWNDSGIIICTEYVEDSQLNESIKYPTTCVL